MGEGSKTPDNPHAQRLFDRVAQGGPRLAVDLRKEEIRLAALEPDPMALDALSVNAMCPTGAGFRSRTLSLSRESGGRG